MVNQPIQEVEQIIVIGTVLLLRFESKARSVSFQFKIGLAIPAYQYSERIVNALFYFHNI
jgi:hypothetical protein